MSRILCLAIFALSTSAILSAKAPKPVEAGHAPKWSFLGDDDSLRATIKESQQVLLVCVYSTDLRNVKPPEATVVLSATVVESIRGSHELGDRITISFQTDSLPLEDEERTRFIESSANQYLGSLRLAFLTQAKSRDYSAEWLYVPACTSEMVAFARKAGAKPKTSK